MQIWCARKYYYVPQTKFGRHIVFAPFLIIIILILILLSFFRQKFIRHISRRLLNGNQWNLTGKLSTMSRCADYFRNFQNGHCCHGNGQNAKQFKNTKMIIAGYSPNRNWWNLIGTTSTSSISQNNRNWLDKLCCSCHCVQSSTATVVWFHFLLA